MKTILIRNVVKYVVERTKERIIERTIPIVGLGSH